jgi:hypothetical protein
MSIIDRFNSFAADFETCVSDDHWERLEAYFAQDATYSNVGNSDSMIKGRSEIIGYFKKDVSNTDRRFDSRQLEAIAEPSVAGNRLSRHWRCTYTLAGTPDLIVEGEARYEFDGDLIRSLEERITPESMRKYEAWMEQFGPLLRA